MNNVKYINSVVKGTRPSPRPSKAPFSAGEFLLPKATGDRVALVSPLALTILHKSGSIIDSLLKWSLSLFFKLT